MRQFLAKAASSSLRPCSRWHSQKPICSQGLKLDGGVRLTLPARLHEEQVLCYPDGLKDYLNAITSDKGLLLSTPFATMIELEGQKFEWALTWLVDGEDGFFHSYCNTVPTLGAFHETGFKSAITRGLRAYGGFSGQKQAADLTADDILSSSAGLLSVFIRDPQFQGQTKDKLVTADATRQTGSAVRDRFELWLSEDPARANDLLERAIERLEERKRKRREKEIAENLPPVNCACRKTGRLHGNRYRVNRIISG